MNADKNFRGSISNSGHTRPKVSNLLEAMKLENRQCYQFVRVII